MSRPFTGRAAQCFAGALAVLVASAAMLVPAEQVGMAGLSVDTLFLLRDMAFGPRRPAEASPVAVILIDEATYAVPPFQGSPKASWAPYFATVLQAVNQAEPKAIGFDIILPTSLEAFQSGHDRGFLLALRAAGQQKRMVLAKFQGQGPPIEPARGQVLAVGGSENVRSVNLPQDPDGIIRRSPVGFPRADSGQLETAFAYELARRANTALAAPSATEILINFDGGMPFLTFSLADLHACAVTGNSAFFAEHFAGKVVLLGTGLDAEDRLVTSRRFINSGESPTGPRCTPKPEGVRWVDFPRVTLPGVLIHAATIDNLLRDETLRQPGPTMRALIVGGTAAAAAAPVLTGPLGWAVAALLFVVCALVLLATWLMQNFIALPLIEAAGAAALAFALLLAFRFAVSDRDKRRIRHMFGLYLAPSIIERMVATGQVPALGGERREMTFLFSDVADFTSMTEQADPALLLPALNRYLEGVFDVVMAHGGLVMDFAGDGVLALFGAPADLPDHAARAVACARDMDAFTEQFRRDLLPSGLIFGHTRIGLHTGEAMVGNFGAARRLKYTAMGDVVNTASRLEGLNKFFGTRVCLSDATRLQSGEADTRPLGNFLLKGKMQVIEVHQLLETGADQGAKTARYRAAYAALARGEAEAETAFAGLTAEFPTDGAIAFHHERVCAGEFSVNVQMDEK